MQCEDGEDDAPLAFDPPETNDGGFVAELDFKIWGVVGLQEFWLGKGLAFGAQKGLRLGA